MNIWIVNPFDGIPGEVTREGRYWSLATELACRGHSVIWWSSSFSHMFKRNRSVHSIPLDVPFAVRLVQVMPYSQNVSLTRLVSHRQFATGFFRMAVNGLRAGEFAPPHRIVISIPPLDVPAFAFKIRSLWGTKIILDLQDAWPETFYRFVPGHGELHRLLAGLLFSPWKIQAIRAVKHADAVTAVAGMYLSVYGVNRNVIPVHVCPIGIRLRELDRCIAGVRKPFSPFSFVYIGSMSLNYDLETLIAAAAVLKSKGYHFRIKLAGLGPKEKKLKHMVAQLGLGEIVEFRGFLPFEGVARLLAECHVAINPILPESFIAIPNKIADYMGAGLPVINSVPGELDEMLKSKQAGTFYIARSVESLAAAMIDCMRNPEKTGSHGRNARRLAQELFDRDKTYPELASFIENLH